MPTTEARYVVEVNGRTYKVLGDAPEPEPLGVVETPVKLATDEAADEPSAPARAEPYYVPASAALSEAATTSHGECECDRTASCPGTCPPACNVCPCQYGYVEGLILTRDNQSLDQALVFDINTSAVLLSTSDLDFDWDAGARVVYGWTTCSGYVVELGYFGVFDQAATASVTGNNDLIVGGDLGFLVNNFAFADEITLRYSSQVHSFEANLGCCGCCCDSPCWCRETVTFVGLRFIDLEEEFSLVSTDLDESTSAYNVRTQNHLFGVQIGERLRGCRGSWSWEGTGKAGVYYNDAQQHTADLLDYPNDYLFRPGFSGAESVLAFVGELNFTGIYHLDDVWGLRAGYNLVYLEGVALAPDQVDLNHPPVNGANVFTTGLLLHGASLGLEARW